MKNRYIFWLLLIVIVASAVYFFRDEIFSRRPTSSWDFVPESAVFVWEFENPIQDWNEFLQTDHWKNMSQLPYVKSINESLKSIDSLMGNSGSLDQVLKSGDMLISTHTISSNQFDFVFFLKIEQPAFQEEFIRVTDSFIGNKKYSHTERAYHGQVINEISDAQSETSFSYILAENHFIGSFTPFLVEDVIRTLRGESSDFRTTNSDAFDLTFLEFDAGNIYMDLMKLGPFSSLFFKNPESSLVGSLDLLNGAGLMDVEFDQGQFYANGFFVPENDSSFLTVFEDLRPVANNFTQFIPESAAVVFYQSFDDPSVWHDNLREFWQRKQRTQSDSLNRFVNEYEFDLEKMLNWMNNQLVQVYMEQVDDHSSKLLLIETKDGYEALNQLNKLSEKANLRQNDTLYFENFGELTINLLNVPEFPSSLFGKWYVGYPQTYYTLIGGYIVLADDVETIKSLIETRDEEYTWKQSLRKSEFLERNLDESNLGFFINLPKAWNLIGSELTEFWSSPWDEYNRSLKMNELVGFQISHSGTGNKYYSSIVIKQRESVQFRPSNANRTRKRYTTGLDTTIIQKPKVVRNHNNSSLEVLLSDSIGQIYLVGSNGDILWKQALDGQIRADIFQVDYFKNGKLQYLLSSDSSLYIIDRNGENVETYPKSIADISVDHLSVIDYDRSRNYRFMLANDVGEAYLLDKEGNRLEGWDPRSFGARLSVPPFHLRVRSRDLFIAINDNGEANATNRRGEILPGFPLELEARINGDIYYQLKSGFDKSVITVVSEEGEIVRFNLEGKIQNRKQLYKPARDTKFWMVKENLGRSFVIARQDLNRLAIIDKEDNLLMEKDYFNLEDISVQYYDFGAGKELIVVNNAEPGKTFIYDSSGNLKSTGINSDFAVSILFYESRGLFEIYTAQGDSLFVYEMQQ